MLLIAIVMYTELSVGLGLSGLKWYDVKNLTNMNSSII